MVENDINIIKNFQDILDNQINLIEDEIDVLTDTAKSLQRIIANIEKLPENPRPEDISIENVKSITSIINNCAIKYKKTFEKSHRIFKEGNIRYEERKRIVEQLKLFAEEIAGKMKHDISAKSWKKTRIISIKSALSLTKDNLFKVPFDDKLKYRDIIMTINSCDLKPEQVFEILLTINTINTETIKKREHIKEIKSKIINKKNTRKAFLGQKVKNITSEITPESPVISPNVFEFVEEVSESKPEASFTTEQENIINELKNILTENKSIIQNGFSETAFIGYELLKETDEKDYFIDPNLDVCLEIILLTIQNVLKNIKTNSSSEEFDKIKEIIDAYKEYKEKTEKVSKNRKFKETYKENYRNEIEKAERIKEEFLKRKKNLSQTELNIIESIDKFIDESDISISSMDSSDEFYKKLNDFVKNVTTGIDGLDLIEYRRYKAKERVFEDYQTFQETIELGDEELSQDALQALSQSLDSHTALIEEITKLASIKNENTGTNYIYYLYLNENTSSLGYYIENDNRDYTHKNLKNIFEGITKIANIKDNDLFQTTKHVKESPFDEKIRRVRINEARITYINLNSIWLNPSERVKETLNLDLDKTVYIIIAGGKKSGDTKIYDYTNRKTIENLLVSMAHKIKADVETIKKTSRSEEETKNKINEYIKNMVEANNQKFINEFSRGNEEIKDNIPTISKRGSTNGKK